MRKALEVGVLVREAIDEVLHLDKLRICEGNAIRVSSGNKSEMLTIKPVMFQRKC